MKIEMKFAGEFKQLEDLLSSLRYKYDTNGFKLVVDCDINISNIEIPKEEVAKDKQEDTKELDVDVF